MRVNEVRVGSAEKRKKFVAAARVAPHCEHVVVGERTYSWIAAVKR